MKVVEDDLKENQVFIASIYDDFYYDKKIELKVLICKVQLNWMSLVRN